MSMENLHFDDRNKTGDFPLLLGTLDGHAILTERDTYQRGQSRYFKLFWPRTKLALN